MGILLGKKSFTKVENILKGSRDSIISHLPSVKIQIIGGKICLRCKCETLLGVVNKLLKTKSLLMTPCNVLPVMSQANFPDHNLNSSQKKKSTLCVYLFSGNSSVHLTKMSQSPSLVSIDLFGLAIVRSKPISF